ncbi:MAG: diguanylate cyclase response regulator [Spirochaetae bacterium HGW-Spirochaetae-5]|nr:MAG: diguanylate cyclase response regulator [Spirochaetae bacterium HGW-Spirochaetae-5]
MDKYNILIVDDEPANLYLLEELLSENIVTSARCGDEMFSALEKESPDIILLDIMMPGIDGLALAGQLKGDERFSEIPVIFISAKNSGEDVAEGLNIGADDYIRKPFNNAELLARISKVMNSRKSKAELYRKATRDNLTGVFNRDYFFEALSLKIPKADRENQIFSIGIIDIDHFKKVNDTYGHQAGDRVLKNLTRFINKSLREYDVLARYGGEEFIFLLDGILKSQAAFIIDRIRKQAAETVFDPENHLHVTFSCGLTDTSEIAGQTDKSDFLVKTADRRLYLAKSGGRNRVILEG